VQLKLQPLTATSIVGGGGGATITNETSSSKSFDMGDHIDDIINEVASGSGTIPYNMDDDEESKRRAIQNIKDIKNLF
jgi:hypothetical protein